MAQKLMAFAGCAIFATQLIASQALAGPIHDAAKAGDLAAITTLLDAGTAIDDRDATQETALITAALAGQSATALMLLENGADPAARNDRGMTALHAAAFAGVLVTVKALLAAGLDLNDAANKFGVTPLIVAAEENQKYVVEYLIIKKADLDIAERHGYSALTRSAYKGHEDIIALLLKKGAACQEIDPMWLADCTKRKADLGL